MGVFFDAYFSPVLKYLILIIGIFSIVQCSESNSETKLSFAENIGPIIWENCAPCHNPKGAGPFDLLTYSDVRKKAKTIKEVINSGYMPPWPADTLSNAFVGEKKLSAQEIKMISEWVDASAPENKSKNYKVDFEYENSLGEPDLVLKLPKIEIKGNNKDEFYIMKVPFELPEEKYLKLAVLHPGNNKIVHHCDAQLVNYLENAKGDHRSGLEAVNVNDFNTYPEAFAAMNILNDDGSYPGLTPAVMHYLPGSEWQSYPEEIGGFKMSKKGLFLINQMHYGPSPKSSYDQSELHLYFGNQAPKRAVKELVLGSGGKGEIQPALVIPPNKESKFKIEFILQDSISVLTINPHMHLLGKSIIAKSISPNGKTNVLVNVPNWDFRWQNFYNYKQPVILTEGSKIVVEAVFDNTENNPFNPNDPPIIVDGLEGSMKSTDEMFQLSINYMDYNIGDENINLVNE